MEEQQIAQQNNYRWYTPIVRLFQEPTYLDFRPVGSNVGVDLLSMHTGTAEGRSRTSSNRSSLSVTSQSHLFRIDWQDIRVGDVIRVDEGQEIPVDLLLLSSSEADGTCSIVTANLDGETSLKTMISVPDTCQYHNAPLLYSKVIDSRVECEGPCANMHDFEGVYYADKDSSGTPLTKDNLLLRGSSLENTAHVYGLCIYTGHQTKLMMNLSPPAWKRTNVEKTLDSQIIAVFILLFATGCYSGLWTNSNGVSTFLYLQYSPIDLYQQAYILGIENFFAYAVLYSLIIPISLYVCFFILFIIL